MAYICPNGDDGLGECSGWEEEIEGIKFCFSEGEGIGIERQCNSGPSGGTEGEIGTLLVGVTSNGSQTECDPYELHIFATYQPEIPLGF